MVNYLHRQALSLTSRQPLPTLMESEHWEKAPTPPPKDARYSSFDNTTMDVEVESGSAPASGSKRKREVQDFDDTIYERRNGRLEAFEGDQDNPTPQKRPRSHAGGRSGSNWSDDDATPAHRRRGGSLRRKQGFANLSNVNLRHAASTSNPLRNESPTRESRFQEGSLNDKPSQQPPSVFTRGVTRTDSGNLQQVDELMNDYHEGIVTPRDSTEEYVQATIEYEKATMPARVAAITEQKKKEAGKHGMFRFGKSFTNTFHPIQLWNKMWAESKEELIAKNRLEAQRKAQEKAEIQARYDQMKRDGQFNIQHVPFAGTSRVETVQTVTQDTVMIDDGYEASTHRRTDSFGAQASQGEADSIAGSEIPGAPESTAASETNETNEAVPTTATKSRFPRLHFNTPSMTNLKDAFRSVRSVRSHSALGGAIGRESSASTSVSPAKADTSTLKRSISKFDLKKERRLSNRVSDLESKLNKARLELKNALDDASPMPKLGTRYERFTPVGTMKRSRFVPGALATLPSERLMFPETPASDANTEQNDQQATTIQARPRNTLQLNSGVDIDKAFENIYDEDEETVKAPRERSYPTRATEVFQPSEVDTTMATSSTHDNGATVNTEIHASTELSELEGSFPSAIPEVISEDTKEADVPDQSADNPALTAKLSALEASYKASTKAGKPKKRKSEDEKLYRPDDAEESSELEEAVAAPKKKRKAGRKAAGTEKKKSPPGGKAAKKTGITIPVAEAKGKKGKKADKPIENFTNGKDVEDDEDSTDELATSAPAGNDSDVQSLEPVYEEEEETSTVPLKDAPSKPTAKSTPARYSRSSSPQKKRSDSLQPAVAGPHRRTAARSPPPRSSSKGALVLDEEVIVAVPGENGVPNLPAHDKSGWNWPEDVF